MRIGSIKAVCLLLALLLLTSGICVENFNRDISFIYSKEDGASAMSSGGADAGRDKVCATELLNDDCGGQTDFDGDISKKRELRIPHYLLDLGSRRSSDCELAVVLDVFCVLYQDPTGSVKAYIHETDGKKRA